MDDKRGDIIQAIEQCLRRNGCSSCENCPYTHVGDGFECRKKLRDDIIALLKAQEPVVPHRNYQYLSDYWCECGWHLGRGGSVKYCPECGRAVKWDS